VQDIFELQFCTELFTSQIATTPAINNNLARLARTEFLTKMTTSANGLSKRPPVKYFVKKDPLLVAACLAN
jgi:hypothetical protein